MAKKQAADGVVYEVFEQGGRFGVKFVDSVNGGRVYVQPKHESHYDSVVEQCAALNARAAGEEARQAYRATVGV